MSPRRDRRARCGCHDAHGSRGSDIRRDGYGRNASRDADGRGHGVRGACRESDGTAAHGRSDAHANRGIASASIDADADADRTTYGAGRRFGRERGGGLAPSIVVRTIELRLDTSGRLVVDVTDQVRAFASETDADGLVHVFVAHATAGVALIETGSGSEEDLADALLRLFPRDDRYAHRHGSVGHGGDHLLPAFVSPSLTVPVVGGRPALGIWQSVVVVDPNHEINERTVRLSF